MIPTQSRCPEFVRKYEDCIAFILLLYFLLILMYVGMLIKALKNVHLALGLIAKNAQDIPFAQEDPALGHIQDTGTKMITAM